jgi:hypothetical protein
VFSSFCIPTTSRSILSPALCRCLHKSHLNCLATGLLPNYHDTSSSLLFDPTLLCFDVYPICVQGRWLGGV